MNDRLLDRLYRAVAYSDVGVSAATLNRDMLKAVNQSLRSLGGSAVKSLEDAGSVRRAISVLEDNAE